MIMRGYQLRLRQRNRSRGLGQTNVDWAGNPVNCPSGTHFAAGACIQLCNQSDPAAQFACTQGNQAAWNAAGAAQAQGASQYTDPATGQVISFTPPMSTATWTAVTSSYAAAASAPPSPAPVTPLTPVNPTPTCAAGSYWVPNADACLTDPAPYAPQQVVQPSPGTQPTTSLLPGSAAGSAVSQANGTTSTSGNLFSTVAGYVNQYPSLISGISNAELLGIVGVGAGVLLLVALAKERR